MLKIPKGIESDLFDIAFQKIDLEGDFCTAIKQLQSLLKKCRKAQKEIEGKYTGYRRREGYFRMRRNIIFIEINKLYNDLAKKSKTEKERLQYEKEASKYKRVLL